MRALSAKSSAEQKQTSTYLVMYLLTAREHASVVDMRHALAKHVHLCIHLFINACFYIPNVTLSASSKNLTSISL
jgi:hypothetical protein